MLKPFVLLQVFGLLLTFSVWVFDPVLQVFDRTKIVDLANGRHYTVIDKYFLQPTNLLVRLSPILSDVPFH